jgi:hypothetical protein
MFAITIAVALAISSTGALSAGSDQHSDPGTPGDPNCYGQMVSWFVQGNQVIEWPPDSGVFHAIPGPGVGNAVRQLDEILPFDVTMQSAKAWTENECAGS